MTNHIFISHSTKDDPFVADLRQALELRGLTVWVDSRYLRGGDQLAPEIERAIREARAFLVVVSQHSLNSEWVHDEVDCALRAQRKRSADKFQFPIIPLGTVPRWAGLSLSGSQAGADPPPPGKGKGWAT
jgi:hypothetical protein